MRVEKQLRMSAISGAWINPHDVTMFGATLGWLWPSVCSGVAHSTPRMYYNSLYLRFKNSQGRGGTRDTIHIDTPG